MVADPVVHSPKQAAEIAGAARMQIVLIVPLAELGKAIIDVPDSRRPVLIFTRKAWRQVKSEKVPREFAGEFLAEVTTFAQAIKNSTIPVYITEGAGNLEDCVQEVLYHWPNADIIRVTADERKIR
jgi:hypothetical protein